MSLYNMINGYNPECVIFLPMLGRESKEYPRFRDCFLTKDNNIAVYTRVGGGNRNCGFGEEKLYEDENFVKTYDDNYDDTYATYEFKVPDKWQDDFEKIVSGRAAEVSDEYISEVKKMYPKLSQEGVIDKLFVKGSQGK